MSIILIRRSQLQPVMKAAAAGGKIMATCQGQTSQLASIVSRKNMFIHKNEENVRSFDHVVEELIVG